MGHRSLVGLTFKVKKNVLISAVKHRERLEIDSIVILKGGEKIGWGKTCIILGKLKSFHPWCSSPVLLTAEERAEPVDFFSFYFASSFIACVSLFICTIQLLFPLFQFFVCLFVFLISHHHFIWAVKVQRSNRQLTWDSWAGDHSSLRTCHHCNTGHPDHCGVPAPPFPKAPPPNSPRNAPGFLFLVFYLNCLLLLLPHWLHTIFGVVDAIGSFCSSTLPFLTFPKSFLVHQKAFIVRKECQCPECLICGPEITIKNARESTVLSHLCGCRTISEIHVRKCVWKWGLPDAFSSGWWRNLNVYFFV